MNEPTSSIIEEERAVASSRTERVAEWMYHGIWRTLIDTFHVPEEPPTLPPSRSGLPARSFKPAIGYLKYLKLKFWILLVVIDLAIATGWLFITIVLPWLGVLLFLPALIIAVVPDVVAYIAIHLRYDTTWYVISNRSLRIRRGIWIIHETTITFENIQNVKSRQGPIQRIFGISDLIVETAGAGSAPSTDHSGRSTLAANCGILEGVANAEEIRAIVLNRLRRSRHAGLGDEPAPTVRAPASAQPGNSGWTSAHIDVLREIRDLLHQFPRSTSAS